MTPATAPPAAVNHRPPDDVAADAVQVYVYDPTDPARRGEVRSLGPGSADDLYQAVRAGRPVAYVSLDAMLHVGPAAEFLNEPTAVVRQEIAAGRLRASGTPYIHIRFADLLAYRDAARDARRGALGELRRIDLGLGLGD